MRCKGPNGQRPLCAESSLLMPRKERFTRGSVSFQFYWARVSGVMIGQRLPDLKSG
jgi:hypothetical protein